MKYITDLNKRNSNKMEKSVLLKRGKEESLRRYHPWIFSGAIQRIDGKPEEGDVVTVYTNDRQFIARGHVQVGSIAVRVLTFNDEPIDQDFWEKRIATAFDLRERTGISSREDNNTYRLVHGEGDNLPGLIIDIYGDTAVMQAHSVGMHVNRLEIAEAVKKVMGEKIKNIYYKSDTTLPYKADINKDNGYIMGGNASCVSTEYGLKFNIDWLRGQKTGFFVDQRENRALLEKYAKGRKLLNMFCYTGGFSVYAMRGGAIQVDSVDSSARAIELTDENVNLNFPNDQRHHAHCQDAFRFLDNMNDTYDLIILDPPAFAKHRGALRNALQGYKRLNAKAFERIKAGGILFTFSCSQVVDKEQFRLAVFSAAALSGRRVRILHQLSQPADHPINIYHPEGEYLKGLVLWVE